MLTQEVNCSNFGPKNEEGKRTTPSQKSELSSKNESFEHSTPTEHIANKLSTCSIPITEKQAITF